VRFLVPQLRERVFVVAYRDGTTFAMPLSPNGSSESTLSTPTVWDAIGNLRLDPRAEAELALRGKWADLLPSVPEGKNYLYHTDRGAGLPFIRLANAVLVVLAEAGQRSAVMDSAGDS